MTPADAVAKVQRILSGHFPPGYIREPERAREFLADDGALCGLLELTIRADDLHTGSEDAEQWAVVVEVRTALLPHQRFGYRFSGAEVAGGHYDDDTWRASWLFALVRAVERHRGITPPAMETL